MMKDRLTELRKKAGYTQQEIADMLGVERSTYACYETGKAKIPLDKLQMLCVVYGVSPESFMQYEGSFFNDPSGCEKENDIGALTKEERLYLAQIRLLCAFGREREVKEALAKLTEEI